MTTDLGAFQALLANMREEFIDELPERCDGLERLILKLEQSPDNREIFNELYRGVHSLKGSGGTHGLSILTTLCHQLENRLTEVDARHRFARTFATSALAYVDLLHRVIDEARQDRPDYTAIEADLNALRQVELQRRKAGLIAESSTAMTGFYQQALSTLPIQMSVTDNGLTALARLLHEPFDFVIVGRELKELNGIAMMAALRASHTRNHKLPALLVTSRRDGIPEHAGFNAIIARDGKQADNLVAAVQAVLGAS